MVAPVSPILDAVIAVNIIADLILKFKDFGIEVNLENIASKIAEQEAAREHNISQLNEKMGAST